MVDAYIGAQIRVRRKMLGLSQQKLASAAGVTFQQVQKYERGAAGIAVARLHRIAQAMHVPAASFFPNGGAPVHGAEQEAHEPSVEFLSTPEALELNLAMARIRDPAIRRRVIELVQTISRASE